MAFGNMVSGAAIALWLLQNVGSTIAVAAYRRGLPQPEAPGVEPKVAVILPVRGATNLVGHLKLLRAQEYAHYRIIASVNSHGASRWRTSYLWGMRPCADGAGMAICPQTRLQSATGCQRHSSLVKKLLWPHSQPRLDCRPPKVA